VLLAAAEAVVGGRRSPAFEHVENERLHVLAADGGHVLGHALLM